MSRIERIKNLLDKGNYLEAASLADENKIIDCRNICQNLDEITEIANLIDDSITNVTCFEEKITGYNLELRNVIDTIEEVLFQLEKEEKASEVYNKNVTATCDLIEELVTKLKISDQVSKDLLYGKLDDESAIESIATALNQLELPLRYNPDSTLQQLKCVRDQKRQANDLQREFCDRFLQYFDWFLNGLLMEFSESFMNNIRSQIITMPGHDVIHNHLLYLAPLIHWIRDNDESTYLQLNHLYIERCKEQYNKELEMFFLCAKEKINNVMRSQGRSSELSFESRKRNSMTAGEGSTRASSLSGTGTTDTQDAVSGKSSEISYTGWDAYKEFDSFIERILHAIHPTCFAEQVFYAAFFKGVNNNPGELELMKANVQEMFSQLEEEFERFASEYNEKNGLCSLYLLVRLSHYLRDKGNSDLFLMKIYREILIRIKRNFDNFMEQQLVATRELKAPKTSKCGVLSAVKNFEEFATHVESLFKSIGGRTDQTNGIDRWYTELGTELFSTIDRVEHSRTPTEMIRLENYNYLHDVLSRYRSIKVECLENLRKKADLHYKEARKAYVDRYFGRPLEKLNIFFEGVEAKLKQGVKEEEISFQLAFSKQELRKVLQMVTLKEVRKGLEEMYKRIEKHSSTEPDSNLIQAIWRDMQDEFLSQYNDKQKMIERCYPSSNLSLTFTIFDVIEVFKYIAQSH